jgi:hypothetical protein
VAFFSGKDEKTSALLLPKIMYRCCRFFGIIAAENSAGLFAENCVVVIADYSRLFYPRACRIGTNFLIVVVLFVSDARYQIAMFANRLESIKDKFKICTGWNILILYLPPYFKPIPTLLCMFVMCCWHFLPSVCR